MSKWIDLEADASTGEPYLWKCDECGEEVETKYNFCPECGDPKTSKGKSINTLVKALEDEHRKLSEMQKEQKHDSASCIYCHEDSDGYIKPIEKNGHAFVRFGMNGWELSLKANGWNGEAKIQYCPMCGRKL